MSRSDFQILSSVLGRHIQKFRFIITRTFLCHSSIKPNKYISKFLSQSDFEIDSSVLGRHIPKFRSIMASQIRAVLRRKHTLPYYKMRTKPLALPGEKTSLTMKPHCTKPLALPGEKTFLRVGKPP